MSKVICGVLPAFGCLSVLHVYLNIGFDKFRWDSSRREANSQRVGFLPVTWHLTCPVTDWIKKNMDGKGLYEPVRFNGFPELKEVPVQADSQHGAPRFLGPDPHERQ
jgi:NitT/TauT family transport system substrate-binding protein